MHLNRNSLIMMASGQLSPDQSAATKAHLAECEFCREALKNVRAELETESSTDQTPPPDAALALRDRLFAEAIHGSAIPLVPIETEPLPTGPYLLAADGATGQRPAVECLREYCSESPDMVLRLMRSSLEQRHWVQLVADDPDLSAHVLLRLPEMGRELLTDAAGKAELPDFTEAEIKTLKWEVKLPDVSFTLDELAYDPNRTEYAEETVIESARADRVRIRFEGKTEGKQVTLEFLNLVDIGEAEALKVYVIEGSEAHVGDMRAGGSASFRLSGSPKTLTIRLFKA